MSDLSIQWLILFVDVSLKAALVTLVAAAGLALLRVRDSNLRHRVWTGVLCGMLLLPALTQILPALRLPFTVDAEWFAAFNQAEIAPAADPDANRSGQEAEIAVAEPPVDSQPAPVELDSNAGREGRTMAGRSDWPGAAGRWQDGFAPELLPSRDPSHNAIADEPPSQPPVAATAAVEPEPVLGREQSAGLFQSIRGIILSHLPLICWGLWIAGGLVLAMRLLVGLWMARKLRIASRPIAPSELPAHQNLFPSPPKGEGKTDLAIPHLSVPILASPLIRVPLTLGVIRPQILLPLDWIDWSAEKLHAVLVHERTHVERGDCAMAVLAEVNRCVYWFHPLAWWLRRRLASLAEAACDDAAIGSTGDRASYARHLLEVAATARAHRGRLVIGGVSMARCSGIESRIDTILDFTRPLSQRLTWGATLVLLGIIVPLVAFTAALRPLAGTEETAITAADERQQIDTDADKSESTTVALVEDVPSTQDPALSIQYSVLGTQSAEAESPASLVLSTEYSVLGTQSPETQSPAQDAPLSNAESNTTFTFAGTVVGPDGQPVAGARVALSYFRIDPNAPDTVPAVLTDSRGRFEFSSKKRDFADAGGNFGWFDAGLMATKEGLGFAYGWAVHFETTGRFEAEIPDDRRRMLEIDAGKKTNIFTLPADDIPIRGRLVNAEGKPIAGASVEAVNILEGKTGDLDLWQATATEQAGDFYSAWNLLHRLVHGYPQGGYASLTGRKKVDRILQSGNMAPGLRPLIVPAVHTDADGRFTLIGIGRDRIADVLVRAPGIESVQEFVRTQRGEALDLRIHKEYTEDAHVRVYPSDFTLVGSASTPVEGRVVDSNSGQPLAGVQLQSVNGFSLRTATDAEGKYRLEGLPLGMNFLIVRPPQGSRHLVGGVRFTTTAEAKRVVQDITLTAGVVVRGRAVDETTGKPASVSVRYFAYELNPHLKGTDSLRHPGGLNVDMFPSDAEGRFEIPVLPGKGILGIGAGSEFPEGVGAESIDCPKSPYGDFLTVPRAAGGNLLVAVNPQPDARELTVDVAFNSGKSIPAVILGLDGQPLGDCRISGARRGVIWDRSEKGDFTISGYFPTELRRVTVYHAGKNLAGYIDLTGEPPEKVEITLRPAATLVGRALDAEGAPLEYFQIQNGDGFVPGTKGNLPNGNHDHGFLMEFTKTDGQGRFELKGIIPGLKYKAYVFIGKKGGNTSLFTDVVVESAETKDLGDLRPKADTPDGAKMPDKPKAAGNPKDAPAGANAAAAARRTDDEPRVKVLAPTSAITTSRPPNESWKDQDRFRIAGRVQSPDGKPVAGAKVRVDAMFERFFEDVAYESSPVAVLAIDASGRFDRTFERREIPANFGGLCLTAMMPGFGFAAGGYYGFDEKEPLVLQLTDDETVRGRVLDPDGKPIAGVRLEVVTFTQVSADRIDDWLKSLSAAAVHVPGDSATGGLPKSGFLKSPFFNDGWTMKPPPQAMPSGQTDANGTFEIKGLGRDRLVELRIVGPNVAATRKYVVARPIKPLRFEPESKRDLAEIVYGSTLEFVADPGMTVEGVVQDEDTSQPIAGAIVAGAQKGGIVFEGLLSAVSDPQGRYRLEGVPTETEETLRVAVPGSLYFFSEGLEVPRRTSARAFGPVTRNIKLKRGVWAVGRATNIGTGTAVTGKVSYTPFRTNQHAKKYPQYQTARATALEYETDAAGRFKLPVIPGRGVLLFQAYDDDEGYRPHLGLAAIKEFADPRALNSGNWPTYDDFMPADLHAVKEINVDDGAAKLDVNLEVDSGSEMLLKFVDRSGNRLAGIKTKNVRRILNDSTDGDSLKIAGVSPDDMRLVVFRHTATGLTRLLPFRPLPGEKERTITLEPPAIVTGRLVDVDHQPLAGVEIDCSFDLGYRTSSQVVTRHIKTGADGRFRQQLPAGDGFHLSARKAWFATLHTDLKVEPGELVDLGELTIETGARVVAKVTPNAPAKRTKNGADKPAGADAKDEPQDESNRTNGAAVSGAAKAAAARTGNSGLGTEDSVRSTQLAGQNKSVSGKSASSPDVTYTFAGTVIDEQKRPIAGAKISLSYFRKSPQPPSAATAAVTDKHGKFEFSMKRSEFVDAITAANWFWFDAGLVAVKDGYGFAFAPATFFETTGRLDGSLTDLQRESSERRAGKKTDVLTLVRDDVPIRGRILNADGQPVVGARIEAFEFWEGKAGSLAAWEAATKQPEASTSTSTPHVRELLCGHSMTFNWNSGMTESSPFRLHVNQGNLFTGTRSPIVPAVRTDANGWFTLKGVGRERIAEILVSGPGIETTQQLVRSRPGEVVKLGLHKPVPHSDVTLVYYPNEFTLVSGPSVPVTGRVTDGRTGRPIAGVGVQSTEQFRGAVTDANGKYRIEGLPLGTNSLFVTPPAGSRYLAGGVTVTTAAAAPPLVRDITLMPGVLVRGRAVDESTGKPVRGALEYFAYETNAQKTESDSLRLPDIRHEYHLDADGRFEIPVLPGPGIVGLHAGQEFPDAVGADQIDGPRHEDAGDAPIFNTVPRWCDARTLNLLVAVNPRPEDDELIVNLTLRSGLNVPVRVLAPDGQPLSGYRVFGARRHVLWPVNPGDTFKVSGYSPTETRRLMVYHEERNLVGHHDLTGEPPKEIVITLQPAATIVGRVLDADGPAFEQADIWELRYNAFLKGKPSADDLAHGVLQMNATTDSQGRFELKGIVPGLKYTAHLNFFRDPSDKELNTSLQGPIFVDVIAKPGQTKDLGDLRLELDAGKPATPVKSEKANSEKPAAKPPLDPPADGGKKDDRAASAGKTGSLSPSTGKAGVGQVSGNGAANSSPAKTAVPKTANSVLSTEYSVLDSQPSPVKNKPDSGSNANHTFTFAGRVVDAAGKPIAGVALHVPLLAGTRPELGTEWKLVARAATNADGRFSADLPDSDFSPWRNLRLPLPLVALHSQYAVEWFVVPDHGDIPPAEIVLYREQAIRGRMIDAEGRPVAGANVAIRGLVAPRTGNSLDAILAERKKQRLVILGEMAVARHLISRVLPISFGAHSDEQGQFVLHGVAAERCCEVEIWAPNFATTTLYIANRQELDAALYNVPSPNMGRPGVYLSDPRVVGPEFTHVGTPDRTIEGRVSSTGGRPVANLEIAAAPTDVFA